MKSEDEIHKLSYMLITQAVAGDENGMIYKMIDEDKKIQVQMHLVEAIQKKWRELI